MLSDRIKEARKYFHLSQTAFGEKVGASIDVIKNLEYGRAKVNETLLAHICTVYGINEQWLRTGEGEMLAGKSADEIAIENALRDTSGSPALRAFFAAYARLNDQNRAVLEQFVEDYVAEYQSRAAAESIARDEAVFDAPAEHKPRRVPVIGDANQDGSWETKHAAMQERKELQQDLHEELTKAE